MGEAIRKPRPLRTDNGDCYRRPPDKRDPGSGLWMQTYSGGAFWPGDPRPEDICLIDIAAALSKVCRFSGHVRKFYSVAQHCVIGAAILAAEGQENYARHFLLHDAAEAYLADVPSPVKALIPDYYRIENETLKAAYRAFNLAFATDFEKKVVRQIDQTMLVTEARDLLSAPPFDWISTIGVEPFPKRIVPDPPDVARQRFLQMAKRLGVGDKGQGSRVKGQRGTP